MIRRLLLALTLLLAGAALDSLTTLASAGTCPAALMKQIDDVNRRVLQRGAYAAIDAMTCDAKGQVEEFVIRRIADGKITRWKPEQGPVELLRLFVGEQRK